MVRHGSPVLLPDGQVTGGRGGQPAVIQVPDEHNKENAAAEDLSFWVPALEASDSPPVLTVSGVSSPTFPLTAHVRQSPFGSGKGTPAIVQSSPLLDSVRQQQMEGSQRLEEAQKQLKEAEEAVKVARVAQEERVQLEGQLEKVMHALALAKRRKEEAEDQLQQSQSQLEGVQASREEVSVQLKEEQLRHRELRESVAAMRSALHRNAGSVVGSPPGSVRLSLQDQLIAVKEAMLSEGTDEVGKAMEEGRVGHEEGGEVALGNGPSPLVPGQPSVTAVAVADPIATESPQLLREMLVSPSPLHPHKAEERSRIWDALDAAEQDVEGLTSTIKNLLAQLHVKRQNVAASLDSLPTLVSPLKLMHSSEAGLLDVRSAAEDGTFRFPLTCTQPQGRDGSEQVVASLQRELELVREHSAALEGIISAAVAKVNRATPLPAMAAVAGEDLRKRQSDWRRKARVELERVVRRLGDRERRVTALKGELQREKSANRVGAEAIKQAKSHLASMHGHLMESPMRNADANELRRLKDEVDELSQRLTVMDTERAGALARAAHAEQQLRMRPPPTASPSVYETPQTQWKDTNLSQHNLPDGSTPSNSVLAPGARLCFDHDGCVSVAVEPYDTPCESQGQPLSCTRAETSGSSFIDMVSDMQSGSHQGGGDVCDGVDSGGGGGLCRRVADIWTSSEEALEACATKYLSTSATAALGGKFGTLLAGGGSVLLLAWYLSQQSKLVRGGGPTGRARNAMLRTLQFEL